MKLSAKQLLETALLKKLGQQNDRNSKTMTTIPVIL